MCACPDEKGTGRKRTVRRGDCIICSTTEAFCQFRKGSAVIRGFLSESFATHVTLATAIWLQTMVPLVVSDTVELQGYFRVADGYFAADHTSFWGCKVG